MNRNTKLAIVGLVVLLVGGLGVWWLRGRGDAPATTARGSGSSGSSGSAAPVTEAPVAGERPAAGGPAMTAPETSFDDDPPGQFTMIGQVLDQDGEGVGGADVWLSSNPPRTVVSEADGSFTIDKLLARTYWVSARKGELVGGPAASPMGASAEPVIIRMTAGVTVDVLVKDEAGKPVAGIVVSDGEADDGDDSKLDAAAQARAAARRVTSGADGKARLVGVRPGFAYVTAKAQQGFAAASVARPIAAGVTSLEVVLRLRRGVLVSGRVIDEAGKPVAQAAVTAPSADSAWGMGMAGSATTDAKGAYQLTLAPGNYRVVGSADDYAPSTSALFAVASTPMDAPALTLRAGGVIVGTVVSEAGAPVPFATVRVGEVRPGMDGSRVRGNTADATGRFEVRSLPRSPLKATAEHDGVASAIIDVDLSTVARRDDLELVLDVAGTIAGVVVDSAGQPVPETTVTAVPDFLKGGTFERVMLAGPSTAATDGSGAFVLRGLADGDYRISARRDSGRMDFGMGAGVGAHTGATGVRVVLATPGRVIATLELASGGAPTTARASLPMQPAVAVAGGKLVMEDVEPGTVDLHLTGPEFGEHTQRDVVVKPGETTDLGTIKLPVPRTLRGKVVDAGGAPVAGAKVTVGRFLVSGGTFDEGNEEEDGDAGDPWSRSGRTARSGDDGGFVIVGVPTRETQIAAETADAVSLAATIPAGAGDPPAMTLVMQPAGGLTGKVTRGGKLVEGVQVSVVPKGAAGGQMSEVAAGPDGTYRFDRLPAGPATVRTLLIGSDMNLVSHSSEVTIVAGKVTTLDVDMPAAGNVTLTVTIRGKGGAAIPSAQVILMRGVVAYKNGKEAMEGTTAGGSMVGVGFTVGGGSTPFKDLAPGTYSVCTVPLPGDLSDQQLMARLGEHMDSIAVHCAKVDVAAAPASQTFTHEVPPAAPLPAE